MSNEHFITVDGEQHNLAQIILLKVEKTSQFSTVGTVTKYLPENTTAVAFVYDAEQQQYHVYICPRDENAIKALKNDAGRSSIDWRYVANNQLEHFKRTYQRLIEGDGEEKAGLLELRVQYSGKQQVSIAVYEDETGKQTSIRDTNTFQKYGGQSTNSYQFFSAAPSLGGILSAIGSFIWYLLSCGCCCDGETDDDDDDDTARLIRHQNPSS